MRSTILLALLLLTPATGAAREPIFEVLAPGVIAVLQPQDNWVNDSNAVIVTSDDGILVLDAPADSDTVRRTIAHIDSLDGGPVRFLVNSHWHSDHTQGNQLYRQHYGSALSILGQDTLRADVPTRAGAYLAEQQAQLEEVIPQAESQLALGLSLGGEPLDEQQREQQRQGIDAAKEQLATLAQVELLPPEVAYSERLTLHLGEREIRLLHVGAHTDGDTIVYLPDEKILLTGDVLDVMPFAGHGHIAQWVEALDHLAGLDVERIVPGHGPVFEGTAQLGLLRDYLATILEGARAAVARKATLEQAQEAIDLSRFREALAGSDAALGRNFDAFAPEAVARAFAEVSAGSPSDGD